MFEFNPKDLDLRTLHHLMIGSIAPRPIALVSTLSKEGQANLAPFSFFNAFSSNPPIIAFSPARRGRDGSFKDTYTNLMDTKECVIHIVTFDIVEQVNISSGEYASDIDEFEKAGFTKLNSKVVKPFRVAQSPVHLECKLVQMIPLGDKNASGNLAICEVVYFYVDEAVMKDGAILHTKMDQVARNGADYYTRSFPLSMFEVKMPQKAVGIGFDQLPAWVFELQLTKNELAQLASIETLPSSISLVQDPKLPQDRIVEVKDLLDKKQVVQAWEILGKKNKYE